MESTTAHVCGRLTDPGTPGFSTHPGEKSGDQLCWAPGVVAPGVASLIQT